MIDTRQLWIAYASGEISEQQAAAISQAEHERGLAFRAAGPAAGFKTPSAFPPRRPQRSPDRQASIERRRRLAASGPMPPALACQFTTGELAVLRVIADEVRTHGVCYRHLGAIAARAGVCRSTARNAISRAVALRLLSREERRRKGQKSQTNLVRIVSKEWRAWIARGTWRSIGHKKFAPTATRLENKGAERGEVGSVPRQERGEDLRFQVKAGLSTK